MKENIRHLGVVVLADVDERLTEGLLTSQRTNYRCRFHEIRARSHYVENVHFGISTAQIVSAFLHAMAIRSDE